MVWSGYLATKPHVGLAAPWPKADFDRVKAAGLSSIGYCSGQDDPAACKRLAAQWGIKLCLDVESGIRSDGPWVQPWLNQSGAGLYGNAPVFSGRRAAFYVLAAYKNADPGKTWDPRGNKPSGPCGWQWQNTHTEFGCSVDRGWFDDWFAPTVASAPPFPYPQGQFLGLQGVANCHCGVDDAERTNIMKWQRRMARRGWKIDVTGSFDAQSAKVCRKFQAEKGIPANGKVGPDTWRAAWKTPVT
jgi:hypothetical protein